MSNPRTPLEPDTFFHVYNHAVGSENLFREKRDYRLFLNRIDKYITPISDMFAYCLLPNHFHLLLRIHSERKLDSQWNQKINDRILKIQERQTNKSSSRIMKHYSKESKILTSIVMDKLIIEQFSHCFNSYSQSFNKIYGRSGALMRESFKRTKIDSDEYLKSALCYIHNNPVKHGFVNHPELWEFSSYNLLFSEKQNLIYKNEIFEWFADVANSNYSHPKQTTVIIKKNHT